MLLITLWCFKKPIDCIGWLSRFLAAAPLARLFSAGRRKIRFKHIFCSCVKIQHLKNFIWMPLHCCLTDLVGFQKLYAMKILRKEVIVSRGEVKIENKQSNCLENNIFLLSRAWQQSARRHHSHHPHHPREGGAHHGGEEGVREQRPPFHHQFEVFLSVFLFVFLSVCLIAPHPSIISLRWKITGFSSLCKIWLWPAFLQ